MAQVHSTPVRVDSEGYTVTIIVGGGGAGIYYGSSSDPATLASSGTFAAAGSTFLLTGPAWVVSAVAGQSADLQIITAPASAQPAGSSVVTKRVTHGLNGEGFNNNTTFTDWVNRCLVCLPVNTTRWRVRIRNALSLSNTINSGSINMTGVWLGTKTLGNQPVWPAVGTDFNNQWLGLFNAALTQVVSPFTSDAAGAEFISSWITDPTQQFAAGQIAGVSFGGNNTAGQNLATTQTGAVIFSSTTNGSTAVSSAGGAAGTPGAGTRSFNGMLDFRIEYEFQTAAAGGVQVGVFIGDSITAGWGGDTHQVHPHESWPGAAALRNGFAWTNLGVGSAQSSLFTTMSQWCWQRADLATTVPDFAVISIGTNDVQAVVANTTIEGNIGTIIANLQSLGIQRIYLGTMIPRNMTSTIETSRVAVNNWQRGLPLGVIGCFDFDKALRLPAPYRTGSAAWTPGAITNGSEVSTTVTVTNAAIGDYSTPGFSLTLPAGIELTSTVTAANTVTVTMSNNSGSTQTIAAGTVTAQTQASAGALADPDFVPSYPHPNHAGYQFMASHVKIPRGVL